LNTLKWKGLNHDPRKIGESTTVKPNILLQSGAAFTEATTDKNGNRFLLPRIEAIHAGRTRNNTRYLADKLRGDPLAKSGVYSWLYPYAKPIIYNHDTNTEASGRVHNAIYTSETKAGREGIIVIPKITEEKAVQSLLDGRLMTVSIGATTDSAVCSYCGTDIIAEGWCGHDKGQVIDDVTVEWIIGQVWFDELSWVNVPADQDAMVVSVGDIQTAEAYGKTGENYIDLSKISTEWLVTQESAKDTGLLPTTEQEGDPSTLLTLEELQAQVAQLTQTVETLTSEKRRMEEQLVAVQVAVTEKDAEITAKDQTIAEKDATIADKEGALTEATAGKESSEAQVAELQTTVEGFEAERQGLLGQNSELSSQMHKATAERVVDLKVVLGKVSNREEALEQHIARSSDSLKDSLADLLTEATSGVKPQRQVDPVENPVSSAITDGKETKTSNDTVVTKEDVLKGLFTGPGIAKRK
jgi:predicted  nucleic acid-binding Zn-ribbon protein